MFYVIFIFRIRTQRQRLKERTDCIVEGLVCKCLICYAVYANVKTLHNHMVTIHDGIRELSYCPLCEMKFQTRCGLTRHLKGNHNLSREQVSILLL